MHERTLFITDPFLGDVSAIDLREPTQPRLLGRLALTGHPDRVLLLTGKALTPAGRDGLLLWKFSISTP